MVTTLQPNRSISSWRLAACLILAGCNTPVQPEHGTVTSAHVRIINRSDYTWQILLAGAAAPTTARIEPNRTWELDLPGGHYRVEQQILNQSARPIPPRQFSTELVAGKTYQWPLITLQSLAPDPSVAALGRPAAP